VGPLVEQFGGWEVLEPLGEGGQSDVFLVRSAARVQERKRDLADIREALDGDHRSTLAEAIFDYARPDNLDELGALKKFKIAKSHGMDLLPGSEDDRALRRLRTEITILKQNRPGLPRLLDHRENDRWIVTELFRDGSLEKHIGRFAGDIGRALTVFRSIVRTVAELHKDEIVHRDIKPANIFPKSDDLILGDFGIAYHPHNGERLTRTLERVGPRDYMPPWADLGERLDDVTPAFDVYMLGKLLWCMLAGKMKLPREYHRQPRFDLNLLFPNKDFSAINRILDKTVVSDEVKCLRNAGELLELVDEALSLGSQSYSLFFDGSKMTLRCIICRKGEYALQPDNVIVQTHRGGSIRLGVYICNICYHYQFFAPGFPQEAIDRKLLGK